MILVLVQLSIPILAGYGIMGIFSAREDNNLKITKIIKNLALIFSVLFVSHFYLVARLLIGLLHELMIIHKAFRDHKNN